MSSPVLSCLSPVGAAVAKWLPLQPKGAVVAKGNASGEGDVCPLHLGKCTGQPVGLLKSTPAILPVQTQGPLCQAAHGMKVVFFVVESSQSWVPVFIFSSSPPSQACLTRRVRWRRSALRSCLFAPVVWRPQPSSASANRPGISAWQQRVLTGW